MKVIVRIQAAKFFDGRRALRPELGDVIDLPDQIAIREIEAGYALPYKEDKEPVGSVKSEKKKVEAPSKNGAKAKKKVPIKEPITKKKKRTPVA